VARPACPILVAYVEPNLLFLLSRGKILECSPYQKGSDNQYVVGGARGKARGWGGGTSSAKAAIVNDVPCASRSAAAVFFAKMDIWACGAEEEVAATGGGDGGGRR
jgi:hypothetical protein